MPWDRSAPTNPKYRSAEHRAERRRWERAIERDGYAMCAQPVCLMPDRVIRHGETWHLGHDDGGETYIGPTHPQCNVTDGAKRARARQEQAGQPPRRWAL